MINPTSTPPLPSRADDLDLERVRARVSQGVLWREVAGEAVLLQIDSGHYYGLDEVGTRVWTLLMNCTTGGDLLRAMNAEFDASYETLRRDLSAFLGELEARSLVELDVA